jgi:hypothetical protein
MLYLYAIVEGLDGVEDRRGAASEPLELLTFGHVTAVGGTLPSTLPLDRATLVAQDRVVRELHSSAAALLPMRFGAGFASNADAARALALQASTLVEALKRVRGKEQMTLRMTSVTGLPVERSAKVGARPGATGSTGREYLERRAAEQTPPEIVPLLGALSQIQRATRVERGRTPDVIATVYQLIDRGRAGEYLDIATAAARRIEGVSVRITGPSPCYAFT